VLKQCLELLGFERWRGCETVKATAQLVRNFLDIFSPEGNAVTIFVRNIRGSAPSPPVLRGEGWGEGLASRAKSGRLCEIAETGPLQKSYIVRGMLTPLTQPSPPEYRGRGGNAGSWLKAYRKSFTALPSGVLNHLVILQALPNTLARPTNHLPAEAPRSLLG